MVLTIDLTEEQHRRLREAAEPLGVTPEQLAKAALTDLLAEPDPEFERVAAEVLKRNEELYRRLV